MTTKRITRIALFTAIALIAFLIEAAFPPLFTFAPGAKLGLANAVVFTALILLGYGDALIVLISKCFLGALFSGNIASLMYSLPAGVAAFAVTAALYCFVFPHISIMSISLLSAVVFNAVQLGVASLITGVNIMGVLPLMLIASVAAGVVVGLATWLTVRLLPPKSYL